MPSGYCEGGFALRPPNHNPFPKKTQFTVLFHLGKNKFQENFDSLTMDESNLHHVYILRCNDGTYYTGCTQNLCERLMRHQRGDVSFTKSRLPFTIVFHCSFPDKNKAYAFEKYLKSGSGIAFRNKHLV